MKILFIIRLTLAAVCALIVFWNIGAIIVAHFMGAESIAKYVMSIIVAAAFGAMFTPKIEKDAT